MKPAALTLVVAALAAALLIGFISEWAKPVIKTNQVNYQEQVLREIVKAPDAILVPFAEPETGYYVTRNGSAIGTLHKVSTHQGYNGSIDAWLALDLTHSIINLATLNHQETPGIGDIIHRGSTWLNQFVDTGLTDYRYTLRRDGGDFDHVTGATITSRAYVEMLGQGLVDARAIKLEARDEPE